MSRNISIYVACALSIPAFFTICVYWRCVRPKSYWKRKGVPHQKPKCVYGSLYPFVKGRTSFAELIEGIYKSFPGRRFVGFYQFNLPVLLIRQPQLIKQIMVKDVASFPGHRVFISKSLDPLWSNNLFVMMGGPEWQRLRQALSPQFNTDRLIKYLPYIKECTEKLLEHLDQSESLECVDAKDLFGRITNDMIASIVFGKTLNSLVDRNNKFYLMGREAADINESKSLQFLIASLSPILAWILRIRFFSKEFTKYFMDLLKEEKQKRQQTGVKRHDIFDGLMEAEKKNDFMTDIVLAAQAVEFLLAGYDTVSTTMCYAVYELALNPEVQEKLRKEIIETRTEVGSLRYSHISVMKYLDMVVSEVLRKWPPFSVTDRKLVKPYTVESTNSEEKAFTMSGDVQADISIYSLHRDPQYYPDPETFDPERFTPENKRARHKFAYIPFGEGPRQCLGKRLALLEVKVVLFYLLELYEIVPCERTAVPLVLSKIRINPFPEDGVWVGFKPRTDQIPNNLRNSDFVVEMKN